MTGKLSPYEQALRSESFFLAHPVFPAVEQLINIFVDKKEITFEQMDKK